MPAPDRAGPAGSARSRPRRWSRRALLGAAGTVGAAGALAGCSWFDDEPPPPPDPLEPLLASTRALAAWYDATLAAHPQLADQLRPPYEAHLAHETALLELIGRPELASASPPPAGTAPLEPEAALEALREAERDGQDEATQACLAAPPERAALLGSIAAARATHAAVL
jgi:hypothetical protein